MSRPVAPVVRPSSSSIWTGSTSCTCSSRVGWRAHAHCLLGTHYHLILEATRESLSAGMQRLNGIYALRFNRRHARKGHLFAERYSSYVLRDDRHLEAALEYILQNPVRAGLCRKARDWAWTAAA